MADPIPWRIYFAPDLQGNTTEPSAYDSSNLVQVAVPRLPYLGVSVSISPPSTETNLPSIASHIQRGEIPLTIGKTVLLLSASSPDKLKAGYSGNGLNGRTTYIPAFGGHWNQLCPQSAKTREVYPIAGQISPRRSDPLRLLGHHR